MSKRRIDFILRRLGASGTSSKPKSKTKRITFKMPKLPSISPSTIGLTTRTFEVVSLVGLTFILMQFTLTYLTYYILPNKPWERMFTFILSLIFSYILIRIYLQACEIEIQHSKLRAGGKVGSSPP